MQCYSMSLRGHKGFRKSKFQKNAPIELKLDLKYTCDILTMIKHMLCYKMILRCNKGVKGQVHKDLPIGLKINGNDPYNLLEMLNIFFN